MKNLCIIDLLKDYDKIVIPEIQREFSLPGKADKLHSLVDDIFKKYKEGKEMLFSTVIGYVEDNVFYVYDGQQRLTVLVIMICYYSKCYLDELRSDLKKIVSKFTYAIGRTSVMKSLESLIEGNNSIKVVDYSTECISKLIDYLNTKEVNERIANYIALNIKFNLLEKEEKEGDIAQFFLDLNGGLRLTRLEVYKSEVINKCKELEGESTTEFINKIDNEYCTTFITIYNNITGKNSTEYTDKELQRIEYMCYRFCEYCLTMAVKQDKGYLHEVSIEDLEEHHFKITGDIMNLISRDTHIFRLGIKRPAETGHIEIKEDIKTLENMLNCMIHHIYKEFNDEAISDHLMDDYITWVNLVSFFVHDVNSTPSARCRLLNILINNNNVKSRSVYYRTIENKGGVFPIREYARNQIYRMPSYLSNGYKYFHYLGQIADVQLTNGDIDEGECSIFTSELMKISNMTYANILQCSKTDSSNLNRLIMRQVAISKSQFKNKIEELENSKIICGLTDKIIEFNSDTGDIDSILVDREDIIKLSQNSQGSMYIKITDIYTSILKLKPMYMFKNQIAYTTIGKTTTEEGKCKNFDMSFTDCNSYGVCCKNVSWIAAKDFKDTLIPDECARDFEAGLYLTQLFAETKNKDENKIEDSIYDTSNSSSDISDISEFNSMTVRMQPGTYSNSRFHRRYLSKFEWYRYPTSIGIMSSREYTSNLLPILRLAEVPIKNNIVIGMCSGYNTGGYKSTKELVELMSNIENVAIKELDSMTICTVGDVTALAIKEGYEHLLKDVPKGD